MLRREIVPEATAALGVLPRGGALCDDMGCGKTLQTTALIMAHRRANTLVVAPVSVLRQWHEVLAAAGADVYALLRDHRVRHVTVDDDDDDSSGSRDSDSSDSDSRDSDSRGSDSRGSDSDSKADSKADGAAAPARAEPIETVFLPVLPDGAPPRVLVASYGMVRSRTRLPAGAERYTDTPSLCTVAWDRVVADEAHMLRNAAAVRHWRLRRVRRTRSAATWALTGTPIVNRAADLAALFAFVGVDWATLPGMPRRRVGGPHTPYALEGRLPLLYAALVVRRTADALPSAARAAMLWPPDAYAVVQHDVAYRSDKEAAFYRAAAGTMLAQLAELDDYADRREAAQQRFMLLTFLRLLGVHPQVYIAACNKQRAQDGVAAWPAWSGRVSKNEEVLELAAGWLAAGASFIAFTHFIEEATQLVAAFRALGYAHVLRLDGALPAARRHALVTASRALAAAGTPHVLVVQIRAGGTGLNLQHLHRVMIPSPDWTPATERQAVGRCHRMGQTARVEVHRFVLGDVTHAQEQIERIILAHQAAKEAVIARFVVPLTPPPLPLLAASPPPAAAGAGAAAGVGV